MSTEMNTVPDEIEVRKARIEDLRMKLIKEEAVLEYLYSKVSAPAPLVATTLASSPVVVAQPVAGKEGGIDLSQFLTAPNTFPSDVWAVISQFGEQEFTAPLVHDVMIASGYTVSGKSPKARISSELAKLAEDGKIIKTFEGKGSTPHKYSIAVKGEVR